MFFRQHRLRQLLYFIGVSEIRKWRCNLIYLEPQEFTPFCFGQGSAVARVCPQQQMISSIPHGNMDTVHKGAGTVERICRQNGCELRESWKYKLFRRLTSDAQRTLRDSHSTLPKTLGLLELLIGLMKPTVAYFAVLLPFIKAGGSGTTATLWGWLEREKNPPATGSARYS